MGRRASPPRGTLPLAARGLLRLLHTPAPPRPGMCELRHERRGGEEGREGQIGYCRDELAADGNPRIGEVQEAEKRQEPRRARGKNQQAEKRKKTSKKPAEHGRTGRRTPSPFQALPGSLLTIAAQRG